MKTREIPLYAIAYGYVQGLYRMKADLPKNLKHDLGYEIFHSGLKLLRNITIANHAQEKATHISEALLEVEAQWTFLRLLYDLRGISQGMFRTNSERLNEISNQLAAWKNWNRGRKVAAKTLDSHSPNGRVAVEGNDQSF